jgi:hypothetical protein
MEKEYGSYRKPVSGVLFLQIHPAENTTKAVKTETIAIFLSKFYTSFFKINNNKNYSFY